MNKSSLNFFVVFFNLIVVSLLFYLPYYLFEGRLFLGGDDTRIFYAYPKEVIANFALFSWNNISSLPGYNPNFHFIPFLSVLYLLNFILSKMQLFYFSFSLILVLGFIYFQKFVRELIGKEYSISFVSALLYVLSPITLVSMSFFLTPVWLIALFPIVFYYYASYLKRGKVFDLLKVIVWSIFLSIAYYSAPWILGLIFPILIGLLIVLLLLNKPSRKIIKRTVIFIFVIISSQLFWLVPFISSLFYRGDYSLASKIASESFKNTFASTVNTTATGNIIYPLLTLYHREIVFDYNWQLKNVFLNYFDFVLPFSFIFIFILFLGVINNKVLNMSQKIIFIFFFASFIVALFLFTVNIGFLKDVFLFFGQIPGFGIFRNFTDKFALSYIFIYASFLSLCLYVIKKSFRYYNILILLVVAVVLINLAPVKQIIVSPLWKTNNVFTTINIPEEYISFSKRAESTIPKAVNVISFPQNRASYTFIFEENSKNSYVGTSPFKFFSSINDLSGTYSYPPYISNDIESFISNHEYENLLGLLTEINVGYAMITNNIPKEALDSYLFNREYIKYQDKQLIDSITEREVLRSDNGNYIIYKLKNSPSIISTNSGIFQYSKNNQISYEIKIDNLKGSQELKFLETYHPGWKLYVSKIDEEKTFFNNLFANPLKPSIFNNTHRRIQPYGNEWIVDSRTIKENFGEEYYIKNEDGSISLILHLYFMPQVIFYLGIFISIVLLFAGGIYLFVRSKK